MTHEMKVLEFNGITMIYMYDGLRYLSQTFLKCVLIRCFMQRKLFVFVISETYDLAFIANIAFNRNFPFLFIWVLNKIVIIKICIAKNLRYKVLKCLSFKQEIAYMLLSNIVISYLQIILMLHNLGEDLANYLLITNISSI